MRSAKKKMHLSPRLLVYKTQVRINTIACCIKRSMEVILTAIITLAGENVLKVELKLQIVSFGKVGWTLLTLTTGMVRLAETRAH